MTYLEAINYLKGLTKFGVNLGLGRIEELMRRLGNPDRRLKIVHIGGTNGKGSTSAMVASILGKAGFKVGLFTSPHLHSYRERFIINNRPIAEKDLAELINFIKPHLECMVAENYEHPTEFEVSTALALLYFSQQNTDYVVLEVGMGGAIDSTNVVLPSVSVITNVSLDHMEYLGETVEEIARVKAGIIKVGVPIVTAAEGKALDVIERVAVERNSQIIKIGHDITWETKVNSDLTTQELTVRGLNNEYSLILPLLGSHQQINAATAITAVEILLRGQNIVNAVVDGIRCVRWPGRFEIIKGTPTIVIDGAHNAAGARVLRESLENYFPDGNLILVLGMLADKERAKVVRELVPLAKGVVVTKSKHPRAGDWYRLADLAGELTEDVSAVESIQDALKLALAKAEGSDVICVTGSLYMVAEVREFLNLT